MKILIFLDFDGVLFDSVKEAFLLSRFAYKNISLLYNIDNKEYQNFKNLRYLITKSKHFLNIWKMLEQNISDKNYFYNDVQNTTDKEYEEFDKKYVNARVELINTNFEFWDSLDKPYDFFFKIKNLNESPDYKFVILSNKKKLPIQNKLKKYNVSNIDVYANEDILSKSDFITSYMKKNHIEKAIFIDDSQKNIDECKNINGLKTYLAGWGYVEKGGYSENQIIEKIKEDIW